MQTSEILNKAADLIEERGWTKGVQGWTEDPEHRGKLCMEGGISAASGVGRNDFWAFLDCPAYRAVAGYLGVDVEGIKRGSGRGVWEFNDASGRTANEVIEVLRAAALIEQAKENSEVGEFVDVL